MAVSVKLSILLISIQILNSYYTCAEIEYYNYYDLSYFENGHIEVKKTVGNKEVVDKINLGIIMYGLGTFYVSSKIKDATKNGVMAKVCVQNTIGADQLKNENEILIKLNSGVHSENEALKLGFLRRYDFVEGTIKISKRAQATVKANSARAKMAGGMKSSAKKIKSVFESKTSKLSKSETQTAISEPFPLEFPVVVLLVTAFEYTLDRLSIALEYRTFYTDASMVEYLDKMIDIFAYFHSKNIVIANLIDNDVCKIYENKDKKHVHLVINNLLYAHDTSSGKVPLYQHNTGLRYENGSTIYVGLGDQYVLPFEAKLQADQERGPIQDWKMLTYLFASFYGAAPWETNDYISGIGASNRSVILQAFKITEIQRLRYENFENVSNFYFESYQAIRNMPREERPRTGIQRRWSNIVFKLLQKIYNLAASNNPESMKEACKAASQEIEEENQGNSDIPIEMTSALA